MTASSMTCASSRESAKSTSERVCTVRTRLLAVSVVASGLVVAVVLLLAVVVLSAVLVLSVVLVLASDAGIGGAEEDDGEGMAVGRGERQRARVRLATGTPQTRSAGEARFPRHEGARLLPREEEEGVLSLSRPPPVRPLGWEGVLWWVTL